MLRLHVSAMSLNTELVNSRLFVWYGCRKSGRFCGSRLRSPHLNGRSGRVSSFEDRVCDFLFVGVVGMKALLWLSDNSSKIKITTIILLCL